MKNIDLERLDSADIKQLYELERRNKIIRKNKLKDIIIPIGVITVFTAFLISLVKQKNFYIPIFKDTSTVYSNDLIVYSSLDESTSIIEKCDSDELDLSSNNIKVYSNWEEENGNWARNVKIYSIDLEKMNDIKKLILENSDTYQFEDVFNSLQLTDDFEEKRDKIPFQQNSYFEVTMVDDAFYQVPAPSLEIVGCSTFLFTYLILLGYSVVQLSIKTFISLEMNNEEYIKNNEKIKELLKKVD